MKIFTSLYRALFPSKIAQGSKQEDKKKSISGSLESNLKTVQEVLGESDDVIVRRIKIGGGQFDAFLLHIDGMSDQTFIADNVMKSLLSLEYVADCGKHRTSSVIEIIKDSVLTAGDVKEIGEQKDIFTGVASGDTALFIEGMDKALLISSKGFESRAVQEPETETVVRGPREGFTEPLRVNTSLLRRRIKSTDLRFKTVTVGRKTKTKVSLCYLKGVCDEQIVKEVSDRISRIDTDAVFGAGFIEEFINDSPNSPFATIGYTERPDVAAAKILEGRVAVIVEGTPIVLTVPHLFIESFQTAEDYLVKYHYMIAIRWLRYLAFFITIYLPGIYLALVSFHQEMVPTQLLLTFAAAREGVPFPSIVEAIGMGITFEILREAGIRMPRPVGQAVSIVGALVIGEAAVSAGIVGAPMVIVTALTAISSFIIPNKVEVTTILRFVLTIGAGTAGVYGLVLLSIIIATHALSLRSFGVPYLSPLAPITLRDLKDVLVKVPAWSRKTRPRVIGYKNMIRQAESVKPDPTRNRK